MTPPRRGAGGRPPKSPDLVAEGVRLVQQGDLTPEEAAEKITADRLKKLGKKATELEKRRATISGRTIRRAIERGDGLELGHAHVVVGKVGPADRGRVRGAGHGSPAHRKKLGLAPPPPARAARGPAQDRGSGGSPERPLPSPLDRLRSYAAHDPEALALLDDLDAEEAPDQIPTLERVRRLIARVERRAANAPVNRYAPLGGLLERLYNRERQLLGPPPAPPDAVLEELRKRDFDAIAKIEEHLPDRITPEELRAAAGG